MQKALVEVVSLFEEARMKAMGLTAEDADPWETPNSVNRDEEKKDEATDSGPVTVDLEEVQRKAREEAAAQIAAAEKVGFEPYSCWFLSPDISSTLPCGLPFLPRKCVVSILILRSTVIQTHRPSGTQRK